MTSILFFILGTVLFCILLLNIISLPANWCIVFFFIILYFLPGFTISFTTILILVAIALIGELLEAGLQMLLSKRHGASIAGNWGGIFGSIVGAIIGIPFLLGLGAIIGAILGAWLGCYAVEKMKGKSEQQAKKAAFGALKGKILGFSIKIALGAYIIVYGIQNLSISQKEHIEQEGQQYQEQYREQEEKIHQEEIQSILL